MGVIWLSFRDGHYYIVDGQHRFYALVEWLDGDNWEVIEVEKCMVLTNLTIEDEAELFLDLNNRKAVNFYDRFQVSLTAGRTRSDRHQPHRSSQWLFHVPGSSHRDRRHCHLGEGLRA